MSSALQCDLRRWLADQQPWAEKRLVDYCSISSCTHEPDGIAAMQDLVTEDLTALPARVDRRPVAPLTWHDDTGASRSQPLGALLTARLEGAAPLRALLLIHLDTVYPQATHWKARRDGQRLHAPGAADAKGGLLVMLLAVKALRETAPALCPSLTLAINADEEIGSPGSAPMLDQLAREHDVGLVFEPCLEDGSMVAARGGSANFTLLVRGRGAHVGRDFARGRNAIVHLARWIDQLDRLNLTHPGLHLNIGRISGGDAANCVPDLAIARGNLRFHEAEAWPWLRNQLTRMAAEIGDEEGFRASWDGYQANPPKTLGTATRSLMNACEAAAHDLGLPIHWRDTAGTCDGNKLAAAGLPVIDTLGVRGANLHHRDEFCLLPSLGERAALTALLLLRLATGESQLVEDPHEPA